MLTVTKLSNKYQKRTLRAVYAQTQATPYATSLNEGVAATGGFRAADGSIQLPVDADTTPVTRTADAYTLKHSLVPGTVVTRTSGEKVSVAVGSTDGTERPFGLLANFVGGELDDRIDEQTLAVGVWRGANHAFFELLAPAYDDSGLSAIMDVTHDSAGSALLYAGTDGRLVYRSSPSSAVAVARVVDRVGTSRILVELLV